MTLLERIKQVFKYKPLDTTPRQPLPQVHLLGYEKSMGKPHPQDYTSMITAYKSWAYACAWKNATSVAKQEISLYKKSYDAKGDEVKDIIKQHPFLDLITQVNPFSNKFELMTLTQIYIELTGNAYWWIPRNVLGVPYMIWNIPSHWMKIVPSKDKFIDGYIMQVPGQGKLTPFDEEEIVHFKFPSPFDLYYGTGPLWAARFGVDLNEQIKTWGINFFLNNAQPSGVLMTDSTLSPDAYQRLRDMWNEKYKGSKNAGKMAILEQGLKYEQTGSTIKDARFEFVSQEVRDEILAIFGVPASKLGLELNVNRATADASDYTYAKETLLPRLTLIQEKINEKILPIYDLQLSMEFEDIVPKDKEYELKERQINLQSGFMSIDEAREEEGLDPYNLPETRVPLISFGLNPAGTPKPEPIAPIQNQAKSVNRGDAKWEKFANLTRPQEIYFTELMRKFFASQQNDVMLNINKLRGMKNVDKKSIYGYIIFNMQESNNKLKALTQSTVKQSYVTGLKLGMHDVNSSIDFNLFEPNVLRAVEQRMGFFVNRVNETTGQLIQDSLKEVIDEGFTGGSSINEIAKKVEDVFGYSEKYRSVRIAQTEVIGAANDGQLKAYREAGIENKVWTSARDEKVRDSHLIDGQTVGINQSFTTGDGNRLQYPGDRSSDAPASDIINCRCTILPG